MIEVIKPSFEIYKHKSGEDILKSIESYGRVCYKSEDKITNDSAINFVTGIIKRGHLAVIEHESITVKIICDRGISHEIVRHRIGSYCQESTRYVNYNKRGIQFIKPCFWDEETPMYTAWLCAMEGCANIYNEMIESGARPEQARSVLPNSLKTEIVCTYNLREWRHFFSLRCSKAAHPQMREISIPLLIAMAEYIPVVFDDIKELICQQ